MTNPLLASWDTLYKSPPFRDIRTEHFKPAVEEAIRSAAEEINAIAESRETPSFHNTVAALDRAGERLGEITAILFNLNSAETSSEMQAAAREISPLITRFSNDITLNKTLFSRIKEISDSGDTSGLSTEELMLLEKTYRNFILGGAGLSDDKKKRFREISEELSVLSVRFEENVLEETNAFILHLTDINDLSGLPGGVVEMARMEAVSRKLEGWVFTLHFPSYMPFMKYSDKRHLRERMHKAYTSRAFRGNSNDNTRSAIRIADLRLEMAGLLGYADYAELALQDRMADSSGKVMKFLEELHSASFPAAERDFRTISEYATGCGHKGKVERWDWAYFSEKLQKEKYDIDDETLKPYFRLENAEKAIFSLAKDLYGISFHDTTSVPVYHPEVKTWEVRDRDGRFLAVLYIDYFPRTGKNGGAWMTSFREQSIEKGEDIRPLISIVANFTRPTETKPSLLSFNEITTFLHEFGHALHGILTRCTYKSLSGTNVARDFVELPSQFMENYAYEKKWISSWARHFETGETIPEGIIEKIKALAVFNEGYACNRQLSFGFLDMAWHTIREPVNKDISEFEKTAIEKTELFPHVPGSNTSVSFTHIFGGGYAAGYYGYKWAEVLDADAFSHFAETGIFNHETAVSFRKNILEKGGTEKPMKLYMNFRGKEPSIDAFLERSGLKDPGPR